jgi:hypothetical protein
MRLSTIAILASAILAIVSVQAKCPCGGPRPPIKKLTDNEAQSLDRSDSFAGLDSEVEVEMASARRRRHRRKAEAKAKAKAKSRRNRSRKGQR